jgi:hypothetical protein
MVELSNTEKKWWFEGNEIEIVPYYKYLGLLISSRMSWYMAQETLAAQANKTVAFILQVASKVRELNFEMYWTLFDKMVLPVLTYGAEIWGYKTYNCIENVQNRYCKYILNVPSNTCNAAARGECGRVLINVQCNFRLIKYWCKLITMDADRFPQSML